MFLCSGTTARCLGIILLALAILGFCVNVLLFFPNGDTRYATKNVSSTVWYLGGIIGSGILMIFPAWVFLEYWDTNECTDCCDSCQCPSPCCQACANQQCSPCLACSPCFPCDCSKCPKCRPCEACPRCECKPCQKCPPCKSCAACECPRCQDCQVCAPCTTCECPTCRACPECKPCQSCDCKNACECPPCKRCCPCTCPCACPQCKPCPECKCQLCAENAPCACCRKCSCRECCQNFCGCLGAICIVCQDSDCTCPQFCKCKPSQCIRKFPLCVLIFCVVGLIGSAYGFIVSSVALDTGPLCRVTQLGEWRHPFNKGNYLNDPNLWNKCMEPENVIPWHVRLFSILLVTSAVQFIICVALLVNILFGMFCKHSQCFKGYTPM
ncbi:keratin-associated protein 10-11-like [Leucoraja erinacea]|uniref:keratin-associated protein 10-11-like n=1 Tax=Leucoraja erinaceus TaxID=7782 RepID=UPI0024563C45|nr:keratin-associated protein 10-11-like [Leucoraja erinacea]